jgi:hypothetical protein
MPNSIPLPNAPPSEVARGTYPLTPFETPEADEEKNVGHIIEVMRRKLEKDYAPGSTRRDAHPKHTGVLQASFSVEGDLPPALRVGVFAEARSYDAWVRFSNASGSPQSDAVKDLRGCAIKLREVPGQRIAESDEPTTQDFLMVNIPTMPLGTVKLFHDAIHLGTEWSLLLFAAKMLLTGNAHVLKALQAAKTNPTSPADIRYWSTTPYLYGAGQAAKYSLVPTSSFKSRLPASLSDRYLSDNLQQHLAQGEASFDFKVQLPGDAANMPIEDAAVEWREDQAPFIKVATLRIPKQNFRTTERDELSEALTFSPAHALLEHRPIGAVNRARMRVYKEQSAFRQQRDARRKAA